MTLWRRLRDRLEGELEPEEFAAWFQPLQVCSEESGRLVLATPDSQALHALEETYRNLVDRAANQVAGRPLEVVFTVAEEETAGGSDRPADAPNPFNPRYDFRRFVVGSSNQFAHAAARAVAENPSRSYNPLFLYGGVGLGKTHLLHAIGHHIFERHHRLVVHYLPTEQFVNDLITSIRHNRMPDFRERYRNIDVLLLDDVQFLAGKERTQEEFFHTFNTLYTRERQIILSSDAAPREIPTLEERLRSRFEWGLIADIQPPDLETKMAILRRKASDKEGLELPDEVAAFIAQNVKSNIRELEGLLNRVLAFASLTGRELSLDLTKETLADILPAEQRIDPAVVVRVIAHHYGLKVAEIKSRNNSRHIVFPRQVAMYVCKQVTKLSFPEIGKLFGKHHSTVIHSVEKIEDLRSEDTEFARVLASFVERFS